MRSHAFAHNRMPTHRPFLILRDPPGDISQTTWAQGTASEVELSVDTSQANEVSWGGGYEKSWGKEFEVSTGFSWGAQMEGVALEGKIEASKVHRVAECCA